MMDKATVIIPCFNVEMYILDCLDSVMRQGDVVHHTYVVDNNSTDDTIIKVRGWQKSNPNFPLTLLSETKPGAPAARNLPLSRVETEWIQFLDADDLLLPGKIENQIHQFPDADVIYSGYHNLNPNGEKTLTLPNSNIPLALIQGTAGITSSNLFSTHSVKSIKGWNESLQSSQEYDFMFRIWKTKAKFEPDLTPRAIIQTREFGQISQSEPRGRWSRLVSLRMAMLESMLHSEMSGEEKQNMMQAVFDFVRVLFPLNEEEAITHYRKLIALGLKPQPSPTSSFKYIMATRLIGVRKTERFLKYLSRLKK